MRLNLLTVSVLLAFAACDDKADSGSTEADTDTDADTDSDTDADTSPDDETGTGGGDYLEPDSFFYESDVAIDATGAVLPLQVPAYGGYEAYALNSTMTVFFYSDDWTFYYSDTDNYCTYTFEFLTTSPASLAADQYAGYAVSGTDLTLIQDDCSDRFDPSAASGYAADMAELIAYFDYSFAISPNNGPYAEYIDDEELLGAWFGEAIWKSTAAFGFTRPFVTDENLVLLIEGGYIVSADPVAIVETGSLAPGWYWTSTFSLPSYLFGF